MPGNFLSRSMNRMSRGEIRVVRRHADDCVGCLGNGGCWVCLGTGNLPRGVLNVPCRRCRGTGMCAEQPETIVIPEPRETVA